jgi:hypothetical protein
MWSELVKQLSEFPDAILTSVDASGYPFSVRCKPEPDRSAEVLRLRLPSIAQVSSGPAGLLCHKHDESLWNLRSFIVRGLLEQDTQDWLFRPVQLIPGAGIGGAVGMIKFVRDSRRSTRQYLEKRHLDRPKIDWDSIHAIWEEVHKVK